MDGKHRRTAVRLRQMHKRRVLLSGATGYIGSRLLHELEAVDQAFYLVHSMASGTKFAALDREAAANFGRAARVAGARRIVYLGGLANAGGCRSTMTPGARNPRGAELSASAREIPHRPMADRRDDTDSCAPGIHILVRVCRLQPRCLAIGARMSSASGIVR
jgi:nucleoside-diphosphate-sugar epimerase